MLMAHVHISALDHHARLQRQDLFNDDDLGAVCIFNQVSPFQLPQDQWFHITAVVDRSVPESRSRGDILAQQRSHAGIVLDTVHAALG